MSSGKKPYKYYNSSCHDHGAWLSTLGFEQVNNLEDSDVIIFGGGADIDPSTYDEEQGSRTSSSKSREEQEKKDFELGSTLGKKFFGICRGQQLLCALAGGKLIQHVTNHSGSDHDIVTSDNFTFRTNSIHHQMINPYMLNPKDYKILAWSSKRISKMYLGARDARVWLPYDFKEIESIYFPNINALSVQYHPEMMYSSHHSGVLDWTRKMFLKFFNNEL